MDKARDSSAAHRRGKVGDLSLLGGWLCLDFVNTMDPRHGESAVDFLTSYVDLADWAAHAGAVSPDQGAELRHRSVSQPEVAAASFERARALRQQLYLIFSAIAAGNPPPAGAVEHLNAALGEAMAQTRLIRRDDGRITWGWSDSASPDRAWWPVARSAAELLTTADLRRLRECPGPDGCGWLFYDTSRNGSRRWCSMAGCGNRVKGRRHYQRSRATPE